jgi:dihydropteroate synthase-like protein
METVACITGRLAERALRDCLAEVTPVLGSLGEAAVPGAPPPAPALRFEVVVLPITVAALMTTDWIAAHLQPQPHWNRILLPGLCPGDPAVVAERTGLPAARGPKDLKDLPALFGRAPTGSDYGSYDALLFAEIHEAPRLPVDAILARAAYYRRSGADVIDLGGIPGVPWPDETAAIRELKARGYKISVDSMNLPDLQAGMAAGADYLLSAHAGQYRWASESPAPVVVVPDETGGLTSLEPVITALERWSVPYILDPILSPINFGFADSLHRFVECRRRYPAAEMMLGAHHLTELLDADTPGVNAVIMGFAQELAIRHILTTEVIAWADGAVRELDVARRLMWYSGRHGRLPKHLEERLLALKDPPFTPYAEAELRQMQAKVRDRNWRIFTDREQIYAFNAAQFLVGTEPGALFRQMAVTDPAHAFYLGMELMKASTALTLGKRYQQEQPLHWGYRTGGDRP